MEDDEDEDDVIKKRRKTMMITISSFENSAAVMRRRRQRSGSRDLDEIGRRQRTKTKMTDAEDIDGDEDNNVDNAKFEA